jgi:hypothetical protein
MQDLSTLQSTPFQIGHKACQCVSREGSQEFIPAFKFRSRALRTANTTADGGSLSINVTTIVSCRIRYHLRPPAVARASYSARQLGASVLCCAYELPRVCLVAHQQGRGQSGLATGLSGKSLRGLRNFPTRPRRLSIMLWEC